MGSPLYRCFIGVDGSCQADTVGPDKDAVEIRFVWRSVRLLVGVGIWGVNRKCELGASLNLITEGTFED